MDPCEFLASLVRIVLGQTPALRGGGEREGMNFPKPSSETTQKHAPSL